MLELTLCGIADTKSRIPMVLIDVYRQMPGPGFTQKEC